MRNFCFLSRLSSAKKLPVESRDRKQNYADSLDKPFYWTLISTGSRFTRKPKLTDSLGRKENWRTSLYHASFVICGMKAKTVNVDIASSHFWMPTRPFDTVLKKNPNENLCLLLPLRNAEGNLINYKTGIFDVLSRSSNIENIQFINNKVLIQTRTVTQSPIQKIRRINTLQKLFISNYC